jgi:hypothetical protein
MHAIEKILADHAGVAAVKTGEIVNCSVDIAGINDLYLQTVRSFFEMGGKKVAEPSNVVMFMDHYAPPSTIIQADNQRQFRQFCWDQGIDKQMDTIKESATKCWRTRAGPSRAGSSWSRIPTPPPTAPSEPSARESVPPTWPSSCSPASSGSGCRRSSG